MTFWLIYTGGNILRASTMIIIRKFPYTFTLKFRPVATTVSLSSLDHPQVRRRRHPQPPSPAKCSSNLPEGSTGTITHVKSSAMGVCSRSSYEQATTTTAALAHRPNSIRNHSKENGIVARMTSNHVCRSRRHWGDVQSHEQLSFSFFHTLWPFCTARFLWTGLCA